MNAAEQKALAKMKRRLSREPNTGKILVIPEESQMPTGSQDSSRLKHSGPPGLSVLISKRQS